MDWELAQGERQLNGLETFYHIYTSVTLEFFITNECKFYKSICAFLVKVLNFFLTKKGKKNSTFMNLDTYF